MASNPFDPEVQLLRKLVLTPCQSRDGFGQWLRMYLGLDFPDSRIDELSTGSTLDTLWEIYDAGVNRRSLKMEDGSDSRRVMIWASRDSYKTLGAAALELLAMLHMDRNVVHLAAIEQQASKAQEYLRSFLEREHLDEFLVGNNKRTVAVLWFENKTDGSILTGNEWKQLDGRKGRHDYTRHVHYVKVIVNTPQSANSDHTSWLSADEVDLIRFPKAYDQAKLIPSMQVDVNGNKQPPITVLTSTRKSGGGLVQREIDEALKTKTILRHWNVLDVSARCPEEKCKTKLPKKEMFYSDETLRTYTPGEFDDLKNRDPKAASKCAKMQAYDGCSRCSILAACQGRLASQNSNAKLLKDVSDTIAKFDEVSNEMAQAELLCRKPGNAGAVYPHFNREQHMLGPAEMWTELTGESPPAYVDRDKLIRLLQSRGAECVVGIDWGYTHCFAVVTGWVDGRRLFILDAFEIPGLEPSQCLDLCDSRIKRWDPTCWPDTAYPAYIATFRRHGYKMRTHKKDVIGGIEAVRSKMMPTGSRQPELYLLRGDDGCEHLAKRLSGYKWKLDQAGNATDIPDDNEDDICDAIRYMVQNTFQKSGKVISTSRASEQKVVEQTRQADLRPDNWMTQKIGELTGQKLEPGVLATGSSKKIKKGLFTALF